MLIQVKVGSLLAYGLGHINSDKLRSYQVRAVSLIFVSVSLSTDYILSLWASYCRVLDTCLVSHKSSESSYLPNSQSLFLADSPVDAKFLNDHDKVLAVERLRDNQMGVVSTEWKWDHVVESLLDIKTWCWFALIFTIS